MEKDDEISGDGNSYTAEFWQYDPRLGRRWNVDPVVKHQESPYATFANNPIWLVDPLGNDTNKVNSDGSQVVVQDLESTVNYQYTEDDGTTHNLGSFEVNENGLIKLEDYNYSSQGLNIGFDVKNPDNTYMDPNALGSLLGALAENNISDLTITGASTSTGGSPSPSRSHVLGKALDLRYLRLDHSGGPALLGQGVVDSFRQNLFNNSLAKFGFTNMLSEHYTSNIVTDSDFPADVKNGFHVRLTIQITDHKLIATRHYVKSRHHNHLHVGGKWGGVIQYSPTIYYRTPNMSGPVSQKTQIGEL